MCARWSSSRTASHTVFNPYTCDMIDTVLTDRIRQHEGDPDFQLISANPAAASPDMPTRDILLDCRLVVRSSCGAHASTGEIAPPNPGVFRNDIIFSPS